jgi:chromosome partitioning protein
VGSIPRRLILGNDLSGRPRAFIKGRDLPIETLRELLSDLILASVPPSAESADIPSVRFNAKHPSLGYSGQSELFGSSSMNVLVFASRKGGSGKSTLAAHLAAHVHKPSRPCLLIDGDPQGSLALWNKLRVNDSLPLKSAQRGFAELLKTAKGDGVEWVFIDTAPNLSASVTDAIRCATLAIIPCRPGVFDLDAVKETIGFARPVRVPYAVVINAAPPKRQDVESPMVLQARNSLAEQRIPVWGDKSLSVRISHCRWPKEKALKNTKPPPRRPPRLGACGSASKDRSRQSMASARVRPCIALRPNRAWSAIFSEG